jgi:hypothetical protein
MMRHEESLAGPMLVAARDQAAAAMREQFIDFEIPLNSGTADVVLFILKNMVENLILLEKTGIIDRSLRLQTQRWVFSHAINYFMALGVQLPEDKGR